MRIKILIIVFSIIFSGEIIAQEIDFSKHPSTWPNPFELTLQQEIDMGYTKELIMQYLEWRTGTLPDLYLEFHRNKLGFSFEEIKWDDKIKDLIYIYRYPAVDSLSYLEYRTRINMSKNPIVESRSLDNFGSIEIKDSDWLGEKIKNQYIYTCGAIS